MSAAPFTPQPYTAEDLTALLLHRLGVGRKPGNPIDLFVLRKAAKWAQQPMEK